MQEILRFEERYAILVARSIGGDGMEKGKLYGKAGDEFITKANEYFRILEENPKKRGCAEDYLDFVGLTMPEATEYCTGKYSTAFQYKKIVRQLARDANRIRKHFNNSEAWNEKPTATKSIFLGKQKLWDGLRLSDQPDGQGSRDVNVNIKFGMKDAFK